jgi:hypothetical protein
MAKRRSIAPRIRSHTRSPQLEPSRNRIGIDTGSTISGTLPAVALGKAESTPSRAHRDAKL